MTDPTGGVKVASDIAQSQYVFGILFVLLFFVFVWVAKKMLDKMFNDNKAMEDKNNSTIEKIDNMHNIREAHLETLLEENKQESREREAQLMAHNNTLLIQMQNQTSSLEEINKSQSKIQESLEDLRDSFDKIEHRIEKIERSQQQFAN